MSEPSDHTADGGAGRRLAIRLWRALPTWMAVALPLPEPRPRHRSRNVEDTVSIAVQDGVRLDVCWLKAPFGPGPAASLYVGRREIMRFDCVGGERGHFHLGIADVRRLAAGTMPRLFFPPGSIGEHIERAAFEVEHNAPFAAATSLDRRVRALVLDPERLRAAAAAMRERMHALLERHRGESPASDDE